MNAPKNNFVAVVDDYHEFSEIRGHLKLAGLSYSFKELDYGTTRFGGGYHAVFTLAGADTPKEFIEELIVELNKNN